MCYLRGITNSYFRTSNLGIFGHLSQPFFGSFDANAEMYANGQITPIVSVYCSSLKIRALSDMYAVTRYNLTFARDMFRVCCTLAVQPDRRNPARRPSIRSGYRCKWSIAGKHVKENRTPSSLHCLGLVSAK